MKREIQFNINPDINIYILINRYNELELPNLI